MSAGVVDLVGAGGRGLPPRLGLRGLHLLPLLLPLPLLQQHTRYEPSNYGTCSLTPAYSHHPYNFICSLKHLGT